MMALAGPPGGPRNSHRPVLSLSLRLRWLAIWWAFVFRREGMVGEFLASVALLVFILLEWRRPESLPSIGRMVEAVAALGVPPVPTVHGFVIITAVAHLASLFVNARSARWLCCLALTWFFIMLAWSVWDVLPGNPLGALYLYPASTYAYTVLYLFHPQDGRR